MSNVINILTRAPLDPAQGSSPRAGECLACFLRRMLSDLDCVGTFAWSEHYGASRALRSGVLVDRLRERGALCDCALIDLVWSLTPAARVTDPLSRQLVIPDPPPECAGVSPSSLLPCTLWSEPEDIAL